VTYENTVKPDFKWWGAYSSTTQKTNDHSFNSMNHTIPGMVSWEGSVFKVARISQACSAISDKWHFACSGPPFF